MTRERVATGPIHVGFVLHVMQVAGAEMLVAETIHRLGPKIVPVVFCLDGIGVLGQQLKDEGVPVIAYGRRPGIDVGVPWRMARDIRRLGIQVLHAHQYTPFFYGAFAARLSGRRPRVIFTEHGRHYPDVVSARRRLTNRLVLDRMADEVNAVCWFSARSLSEKDGFSAERITVIENGVELSRYHRSQAADRTAVRLRLGLDPARRYIAMVARFHPVKDHRTMLSAFAKVAESRPDVDLLLVGDGELRSNLEALAAQLGLQHRVRFMGVRADVPEILGVVDVFALTSISEAASITLLEAMASTLPVVVTAVGGNPEMVRDGVDGLMAPRGDVEGIARSLGRVLDDESLAASLAASAHDRVRKHYTLDRTVERYHAMYTGASRTDPTPEGPVGN